MAQRRASRRTQRGVALMALLAVAVMVFAYVLVSRLNAASRFVGIDRDHNAMVLARAKRALIGWMAINAATDNNPGRLPCPEHPWYVGIDIKEGTAGPSIGVPNPGVGAPSPDCTLIGRLPWRTLGLDKLVDAASEPLWYAVSPGWALQNSSTLLSINSDRQGAMVIDGQAAPNEVVALIIAPGPAMNVQAAAGCTAVAQARAAPAPAMAPANYIECFNAATPAFSTTGPATSFNDQVLRVTAADLIPALEAVIAERMQREIAPALRTVYGAASWGTSAGNPLYPFAARFDLPHPGASGYRGEDGRYQGLLPFNSSSATCGADPRCTANFVTWNTGVGPTVAGSGGLIVSSSCNFPNASTAQCTGVYAGTGIVTLSMLARASNVAMALRALAPNNMTVEYGLVPYGPPGPGTSASATFSSDGSANLTLNADVPGLVDGLGLPLNVFFRLTADLGVIADHALLNPADPMTGWFVRNEWYRLIYYAAAQESTADGLPSYGCDSTDCLRYNASTPRNIRALLVLAGRSLSNPAGRPNGTLADYLEYQNVDLGTLYEQRQPRASKVSLPAINAPFNDRLILVDWLPPPAPQPSFPVAVLP